MTKRVHIIEYGAGNIFNVVRAFEYLDCRVTVVSGPDGLPDCDFLVLPGVGAFGEAMATLRSRRLVEPIQQWISSNRPFLGICLGMQLLLGSSDEFGLHHGLGVVAGRVTRLRPSAGLRVPNIGWLPLDLPQASPTDRWKQTPLRAFPPGGDVYFVHSYAAHPDDPADWLARTDFGDHAFCSVLQKNSVLGCQFHPEKSGGPGLAILKGFLDA